MRLATKYLLTFLIFLLAAILIVGPNYGFLNATLFFANLLGFAYMALDKHLAKIGRERIPEKFFIILAFLGASPSILIGIRLFRHKSRKKDFFQLIVTIFVAQILLLLLFKYLTIF